jgi:hypothetical protein
MARLENPRSLYTAGFFGTFEGADRTAMTNATVTQKSRRKNFSLQWRLRPVAATKSNSKRQ